MSNKPRASQISVNTTGFTLNLSSSDDNIQKCFDVIDQLVTSPGSIQLFGDLDGYNTDAYVTGFNGIAIDRNAVVLDGYAYIYNSSSNKWIPGQVSTTGSHNSLLGIQGGTTNQYYHFTSDEYTWLRDGYTNNWSVVKGGTGITSYSAGDILYASGINTLSKLPKSTDGYYLQLVSGLPSWQPVDTAGSIVVDTSSFNKILSSSDTTAQLALNTLDDHIHAIGGDLSNTLSDAYIVGFNGYPLETTQVPSNGQVFFYNGAQSKWWCSEIGGDVSGSFEGVTVDRIKNIEVDVTGISDGYSLVYNQGTNKWLSSLVSTTPGVSVHNSLTGIQGGTTNQYYHFTLDEYTWLRDGYTNKWSAVKGGTGISSYAIGDILYATSTTQLSRLPVSTDGYYLKLASGLPTWSSVTSGSTSASGINTDTSSFNALLSSSDSTVQKALDTLDNHVHALTGDCDGYTSSVRVKAFNGVSLDLSSPSDGYTYIYSQSASKWVPTKVNNSTVITVGKQDLLTANATSYVLSNFTESTDETAIAFLAPVAGTLSNLVCYCGTAPGGSESVVITVRKNSVDTTITATISGAGTTASDTSNVVNIASGDRITFKSVVTSGSSAANLFVSLIFTVPNLNSAIVSGGGGSTSFGTFASMPASSSSGSIYVSSDSKAAIWGYSGSAWRPIIRDTLCTKPPLASAFTKINDGGAGHTLVDNKGTLTFSVPNDGAHTYNRGYVVSYNNATAYIDIALPLNPYADASTYNYFGIIMREAATAKSYSVGLRKENTNFMNFQTFFRTNDNDEANYAIIQVIRNLPDIIFLRIIRSGSNIISQYSIDRQNWVQFESRVTTAVFTTAPDQVGITGWGYNAAASTSIYHLEYGSL